MYFEIKEAVYQKEYKIHLLFEDGSTGIADLSSYKNKKTYFLDFKKSTISKNFESNMEHLYGEMENSILLQRLYMKKQLGNKLDMKK